MKRASFLDQTPPPGYIAGIGRGATGFSTRGDTTKSNRVPKRLQGQFGDKYSNIQETSRDHAEAKEELEAERVFAEVDSKLNKKSKKTTSSNERASDLISQQFADLKRSLANVTEDEWLNIPEAGDITKRHKRERLQDKMSRKEYAAPDSLVQSNVDLSKLTQEREKLLVSQLDSNLLDRERTDKVELTEMKSYLRELETSSSAVAMVNNDQGEDLRRMRDILNSYRKADSKRPEGWIASARLEEKAGKFRAARNIIEEGCQACPRDESVWLENLRLNSSDISLCKSMVAEALAFNTRSLALWLAATELEGETFNKCRVLRKALQEIPDSEELWKLIVKYEDNQSGILKILEKAVEFVPHSVNLWESLILLQSYSDAKKSLNKARKLLPKEFKIWILAAQLEERFNSDMTVERLAKLLSKGRKELEKNGVVISLIDWLREAQEIEKKGNSPKVAESLVLTSLEEENLQQEEKLKIVESLDDKLTKIVAFRFLLCKNPVHYTIWSSLRSLCEKLNMMPELYKTFENILFDKTTEFIVLKRHPVLSLMYSKEIWKYGGDKMKALDIIERTRTLVPDALQIWLAQISFLCLSSCYDKAEETFSSALKHFDSQKTPDLERLYYKYVSFLRFRERNMEAIVFIDDICQPRFPSCPIFTIQKGQILHDLGEFARCRETFSIGTKKFETYPILWILLARIDEINLNRPTKARSDLDVAVLKNPREEALYLAKIRLEARLGNYDQARLITSQCLQQFPNSPRLWSENIRLLPSKKSSLRKTMFQDALKHTNNSCEVLIEIGISFYRNSQYSVALKWFERAVKSNPRYGDGWVYLARCLKKLNKDTSYCYEKVLEHEPNRGDEWITVSKKIESQYSDSPTILRILTRDYDV